jgi:hypothetical protein
MTIHTAIEIPCQVEKKNAVYFSIIRPKNAKNELKCHKVDFLKLKKNPKKRKLKSTQILSNLII